MAAEEKTTVPGSQPIISVIIPTRNGAHWLDQLLTGLERQTRPVAEILIVDSSSTDATCSIAGEHGVQVLQIDVGSFDHGGTRSMAAQYVHGNILVFMTQDAVLKDDFSIERLIAPFLEREDIGAAYGRQLPAAGADCFARHLRLHNYPETSSVRCWQDRERYGFKTVFISNSFAAYRRDVLAGAGFFPAKQIFGEDSSTLAKILENGYCVAYVSTAQVLHSHNYSLLQDFRRYFDIGVFHACNSDLLGKFGSPTGAGKRFVRSELSFLYQQKRFFRLPESILRSVAKLVAYQLGKRYKRLPEKIIPFLSLHRRWWS